MFATRRYSDGTTIRRDGVKLAAKALFYATSLNVAVGAGITFGISKAMDVHSVKNLSKFLLIIYVCTID